MSKNYGDIAFTAPVQDVQQRYGTRAFYARHQARARASIGDDALTDDEREFLAERDGFYLASVGATGWPYVQYRGGPTGFVRTIDDHTIGWADFRGNLQYISTGNMSADDRVALFAMDYAHRRRLKLFGHASIVYVEDDPDLVAQLAHPDYDAAVERAITVRIDAFDWNCPQHITPRFTAAELEPHLTELQDRIAYLEAENARLRAAATDVPPVDRD